MGRDNRRRASLAAVAGVAVLASVACSPAGRPTSTAPGPTLEVTAAWSGEEQAQFQRVLDDFHRRTGINVRYTSASNNVAAVLDARLAAGNIPDVALLPQPGLLQRYASTRRLVPLDNVVGPTVARNYSPTWTALASAGGHLYGVWFKAANKSLVWYDIGAFEQAGVVPPDDLDRLMTIERLFAGAGVPPLAVGGKDGWTLTDWFENLYLRVAGARRYDLLASHQLPWTDPSVTDTLRLMSRLLAPEFLLGGDAGALATDFPGSVAAVFGRPSRAAMVFEGDFVAGALTADGSKLDVDADVFAFPRRSDEVPSVVAGGDVAVLLRPSGAGDRFLQYLATPAAAAVWASRGGFISPNEALDLSVYPDAISRTVARQLLQAGDTLRFDLSDLQPPAFGASQTTGMRPILQQFLSTRDVEATAASLEEAAAAAYRQ